MKKTYSDMLVTCVHPSITSCALPQLFMNYCKLRYLKLVSQYDSSIQ